MKLKFRLIIISFLIVLIGLSQSNLLIKGQIIDQKTNEALCYANIVVLHKNMGTISNESGHFSLNISELEAADTVSFQYIGYRYKKILLSDLDSNQTIYLEEEIFNINECFVFGDPPNPEDIISRFIEKKDSNYLARNIKGQTFVRQRDINDINSFNIKVKRNSLDGLDNSHIDQIVKKIPKHNTSYSDFLGDLYFNEEQPDSFKVDPIKVVALKEKEFTDLDQVSDIFEKLLTDTEDKEYWKVKSGLFSQKLDLGSDSTVTDSLKTEALKNDSIPTDSIDSKTLEKGYRNSETFQWTIAWKLRFALMNDKSQWEFLYHTNRYHYQLSGGTRVNGEDVYIIDFKPKSSGKYIGRVYISINSHALIRADYQYAEGKKGIDFKLLGVGYTESFFGGSIYFEKKKDTYALKYLSIKSTNEFYINRSIDLLKKRKRFLLDKDLMKIKSKLTATISNESSFELMMLNESPLSKTQFENFNPKEKIKMQYVDQFSEDLWKGYSIIEPTQQMKEYKKHRPE